MNVSEIAEQGGKLEIYLSPSTQELAPVSDGLSGVLLRVTSFLKQPMLAKLTATQLKAKQKERRERAITEVRALFPVTNDDEKLLAAAVANECTIRSKSIISSWEEGKKRTHEAHAWICAQEARELEPLAVIREAADGNANAYAVQQREAQRLREHQEAQARDAEASALRQKAKEEEDRARAIEEQARQARAQGDIRTAKALVAEATATAGAAVELVEQAEFVKEDVGRIVTAPKIDGRQERWPWVGECTDPMALIKAIAAGEFPLYHDVPQRGGGTQRVAILEVNQAVITTYAKKLEKDAKIPGVTFREELQSAYRSK